MVLGYLTLNGPKSDPEGEIEVADLSVYAKTLLVFLFSSPRSVPSGANTDAASDFRATPQPGLQPSIIIRGDRRLSQRSILKCFVLRSDLLSASGTLAPKPITRRVDVRESGRKNHSGISRRVWFSCDVEDGFHDP